MLRGLGRLRVEHRVLRANRNRSRPRRETRETARREVRRQRGPRFLRRYRWWRDNAKGVQHSQDRDAITRFPVVQLTD